MATMTKDEIKARVRRVVLEQTDLDAVADDVQFDSLGVDSLGVIAIVIALEDAFAIKIPQEKDGCVDSIDGAVAVIEEELQS